MLQVYGLEVKFGVKSPFTQVLVAVVDETSIVCVELQV